MARTDGIGRGLLHGGLIGAAALAALSLAVPVEKTAPSGPALQVPASETEVAATPRADVPSETAQTGPDADAGRASGNPPPATSATDGASPAEISVPEDGQAAIPDASQDNAGAVAAPQPETRMAPPTGSEFARAEDLAPTVPAASVPPSTSATVAGVAEPAAESLPQPTTGPGSRPDAQNQTETPRAADEGQLAVDAPMAEAALPATQPNPLRPDQPGQDAGLAPASRAAPTAPEEAEATALPRAESLPASAGTPRPDAPGAPDPATITDAATETPAAQTGTAISPDPTDADTQAASPDRASEVSSRPAAPTLETPDPRRETVPPPPVDADEGAVDDAPSGTEAERDASQMPDAGPVADAATGDAVQSENGLVANVNERNDTSEAAVENEATSLADAVAPSPSADGDENAASGPAVLSDDAGEAASPTDPQMSPSATGRGDIPAPGGSDAGRPAPDLDVPALPLTVLP